MGLLGGYYEAIKKHDTVEWVCKKNRLNHLTRILLPEFSLYPHKPLSLTELSKLYQEVYKIAEQQLENVHVLLSSFPVVTEESKILNMCLYAQCGKEPKLNTFCKANAHRRDKLYDGFSLFSQKNN